MTDITTDVLVRTGNMHVADRYAAIKAEIERLTKALDAAKAEIKAAGVEAVEGDRCTVCVSLSERNTLDSALVKQILTADQVRACTKVTLVETLRIKPRI